MKLRQFVPLAIGSPWIDRLAGIMGVCRAQALNIANGKYGTHRRRVLLLERYARQKIGATSSRRARMHEAADRRLQAENDALAGMLAWCQAELEKKK